MDKLLGDFAVGCFDALHGRVVDVIDQYASHMNGQWRPLTRNVTCEPGWQSREATLHVQGSREERRLTACAFDIRQSGLNTGILADFAFGCE